MARLNTGPEPTPNRESALYRDLTPSSTLRRAPTRSSTRASTYSVLSPSPAPSSDKENQPDPRDNTPRANKKGKSAMGPPSLPIPNLETSHGNKRRRLGEYNVPLSSREPVEEDANLEDIIDLEYYDPDQDPEERRELRREMRQNLREMNDRRDELIAPDNRGLIDHLNKASALMKKVKQTSDAVIDSRFLVTASDLALKKTANTVRGDSSTGVDLDEFVSKCITFMKTSGAQGEDNEQPVSTQARHRRRTGADSDDEDFEDIGDGLDWGVLGERVCFPCNKRPPVPSFLLGPLSVQKRIRTIQPRRGRLQKETRGPVTRPESLEPEDIKKAESSNLTKIVGDIRATMKEHIENSMDIVEAEMSELENAGNDEFRAAMRRHRISLNSNEDASVSLFDFVVNPHSFGQTVENLFCVSFLIREGNAKVDKDSDGLPVLCPDKPRKIQEQRDQGVSNHQAVFSLDWPTWKGLIEAFNIKEPLIAHRQDEESATINGKSWYG